MGLRRPNSLFERGVNICGGGRSLPMPSYRDLRSLLREPLAGTTVHTLPGTPGHLQAWFPQFRRINRLSGLGKIRALFRLTSETPVVRTHLRPLKFRS
jgi:hypothetical protein